MNVTFVSPKTPHTSPFLSDHILNAELKLMNALALSAD